MPHEEAAKSDGGFEARSHSRLDKPHIAPLCRQDGRSRQRKTSGEKPNTKRLDRSLKSKASVGARHIAQGSRGRDAPELLRLGLDLNQDLQRLQRPAYSFRLRAAVIMGDTPGPSILG